MFQINILLLWYIFVTLCFCTYKHVLHSKQTRLFFQHLAHIKPVRSVLGSGVVRVRVSVSARVPVLQPDVQTCTGSHLAFLGVTPVTHIPEHLNATLVITCRHFLEKTRRRTNEDDGATICTVFHS